MTRLSLDQLACWQPAAERPDPIVVLEQQERSRLSWLLPERHRRMAQSAFAFYRGTPAVMAIDLGRAAHSGLEVQLCGDAHLGNFGFYASPERSLLFDLNDFDETVRGPFEWDLKRLITSLVIAGRDLQLSSAQQCTVARQGARAYRRFMRQMAEQSRLEVWYLRTDVDSLIRQLPDHPFRDHVMQVADQARQRDSRQAVRKLCEVGPDGKLRFRHDPPLIWRHAQMPPEAGIPEPLAERQRHAFVEYLQSLRPHLRRLLSGFRLVDTASKAVGVGSVGSRCSIGLFLGEGPEDVLVLQSKQAEPSVLTAYATSPAPEHQGQRVVEGQWLMQTVSDPFLGWTTNAHHEHLYWRHFRDWKGAIQLEHLDGEGLNLYGKLCAATLAKAHARSGDRAALAQFMAGRKNFDRAISEYAVAYADQSAKDYATFLAAVASGRLRTSPG
jgi:uncharacterized protein (DUF2252 family)